MRPLHISRYLFLVFVYKCIVDITKIKLILHKGIFEGFLACFYLGVLITLNVCLSFAPHLFETEFQTKQESEA